MIPTKLPEWVRLPTTWIGEKKLCEFRWKEEGSSNIAALLCLIVIANHMNGDTAETVLTYDDLQMTTGLSRPKISAGLRILETHGLISRRHDGRSSFKVENYAKEHGWGMLPAQKLYRDGVLIPFQDFKLRTIAELDALKLYFLFVFSRDRSTNHARISYPKIEDYTGVPTNRIRKALSLLITNNLVQVNQALSFDRSHNMHEYRLSHINPRQHKGTNGRSDESDFGDQRVSSQEIPF